MTVPAVTAKTAREMRVEQLSRELCHDSYTRGCPDCEKLREQRHRLRRMVGFEPTGADHLPWNVWSDGITRHAARR
jgi:hypothetical protein